MELFLNLDLASVGAVISHSFHVISADVASENTVILVLSM